METADEKNKEPLQQEIVEHDRLAQLKVKCEELEQACAQQKEQLKIQS